MYYCMNEANKDNNKNAHCFRKSVTAGSSMNMSTDSYLSDGAFENMEKVLMIWLED